MEGGPVEGGPVESGVEGCPVKGGEWREGGLVKGGGLSCEGWRVEWRVVLGSVKDGRGGWWVDRVGVEGRGRGWA